MTICSTFTCRCGMPLQLHIGQSARCPSAGATQSPLESILSHREARQITNDYTLRFAGKLWQIPRSAIRPGTRNGTAQLEQRLAGSLAVTFRGVDVPVKECILPLKPKMRQPGATPGARVPKRSKARQRWMDNFDLHWAPTLAHILAQEGR
jgi:hypothetical protein